MGSGSFVARRFRRIGLIGLVTLVIMVSRSSHPPHPVIAAVPLAARDWAAIRALLPVGQQAYFKPSQVSASDGTGLSVAVSGDTVVIGVYGEDSGTVGVQNSATPTVDESVLNAGAAYVFVRNGTTWSQQAYLKASQVSQSDGFGISVAVSGNTIVVGAPYEDSNIAGVQNTATPTVNESTPGVGAAYVFVRSGTTWSQQAYLKASQVSAEDAFGWSVAVADDTVVVGAMYDDSSTVGVQNSVTPTVDETATNAGAAYVFGRSGTTWSQQAYLKASQVSPSDSFGRTVSVAGETIVVGAPGEASSTSGVQNTATPTVNESLSNAGAAYVFTRSGTTWSQQAYLKTSQVSTGDSFGYSVAVSGNTIVVGAPYEDSSTAGVQNSAQPTVDEAARDAGAAYVFARSGTTWSQQAYLKASHVSVSDNTGFSVGMSGNTVIVGAYLEDSSTAGVQNSALPTVDEALRDAGAAYGFARSGTAWSQFTYLKASQVSESDFFGFSVAVSGDTMVIGGYQEDSSTAGVQQSASPIVDEGADGAGAAYGFTVTPLRMQYLPLVTTSQPLLIATLTTDAVPTTPVSTPGMMFFTTTIMLPSALPSSGHYWLSASPTMLVPSLVDDAVILRVGLTEILRHDYGLNGQPQATLVEVPASVLLPWAGQTVTVILTDISGSVYSTTPLYLVWTP